MCERGVVVLVWGGLQCKYLCLCVLPSTVELSRIVKFAIMCAIAADNTMPKYAVPTASRYGPNGV